MRNSRHAWLPIGVAVALLVAVVLWATRPDPGPRETSRATPVITNLTIDVTGDDYQWHLRYPGRDGELGTADDVEAVQDLHLPVGARAELRLHSRDFLYTLAFPEFDLKEIAVPDLEFKLEVQADEAGDYELRGDQFCGFSHPDLLGRLIIESPAEFDAWLESRRAAR